MLCVLQKRFQAPVVFSNVFCVLCLCTQSELAELTQFIKQSTSSITENLKDQPTVLGNLHKIQVGHSVTWPR